MKSNYWKAIGAILVAYSIVAGFLGEVPRLHILNETIRNLYFHVTMWFSMMAVLMISVVYSIRYLSSGKKEHDLIASETTHVGIFLGIMGLLTGMMWAKFTWSDTHLLSPEGWWVNDVKLNGAAITVLTYLAYRLLRDSVRDEEKRARLSAVYNIFAFVMLVVFLMILPRLTDSLHPGNGGNPAFGKLDLNSNMRMVFYPAVIGWVLISLWIVSLRVRLAKLRTNHNE